MADHGRELPGVIGEAVRAPQREREPGLRPLYDRLAVAMLLTAIDTPELAELGIFRWTWPGHTRPPRLLCFKRNGRVQRVFDGAIRGEA